ncbi:MAG: prepilin-type N-terminal cleavage/methylation domain-containing protein [Planctomycetes bacterium]|nr:prepilin-type N-terminal cleavage/methylation domain-containing protein [Planctomycetota bacterium]
MTTPDTQIEPRRDAPAPHGRAGFTLIELLVSISIIAILVGITLPVLSASRRRARTIQCGQQLSQMHIALRAYLADYNQIIFWRAKQVDIDGMDWYVYGGRETGNIVVVSQADLFNRIIPRPLNPYVSSISLFRCPDDIVPWPEPTAAGRTHFGYVGNSYNFNSNGSSYPPNLAVGGLAGVSMDQVREPSRTIVFLDASLAWYPSTPLVKFPEVWHGGKGNVGFADGHVLFMEAPSSATGAEYTYIP